MKKENESERKKTKNGRQKNKTRRKIKSSRGDNDDRPG